jgi:hypothetical protein
LLRDQIRKEIEKLPIELQQNARQAEEYRKQEWKGA